MALIYCNRKKDIYYLHSAPTKKGNLKYFFSKSKEGEIHDSIPEGYEIYENPNAQVFLRKIVPQLFYDEEIEFINNSLKKNKTIFDYKLDIRKDTLTIYLSDKNKEDFQLLRSEFFSLPQFEYLEKLIKENLTYTAMLRFKLIEYDPRNFMVERYYFGGDKGWFYLDSSTDLKKLTIRYCQHLGKDSFFELM